MSFYFDRKLRETQHSYAIDFTIIRCNAKFEESCTLSPDFTWQKRSESNRIYLVRGVDHGRPAWHYVLLIDDEETLRIFKEKTQGSEAGKHAIDVSKYGQVLKSGFGKEPPNEVTDWIHKSYHGTYT